MPLLDDGMGAKFRFPVGQSQVDEPAVAGESSGRFAQAGEERPQVRCRRMHLVALVQPRLISATSRRPNTGPDWPADTA